MEIRRHGQHAAIMPPRPPAPATRSLKTPRRTPHPAPGHGAGSRPGSTPAASNPSPRLPASAPQPKFRGNPTPPRPPDCLELNGLADDPLQARIEAHYTFLSKFLHPTHNAARDLHEHANVPHNPDEWLMHELACRARRLG